MQNWLILVPISHRISSLGEGQKETRCYDASLNVHVPPVECACAECQQLTAEQWDQADAAVQAMRPVQPG